MENKRLLIVTWISTTTCFYNCPYCPSRLSDGSVKEFTNEQYDGLIRFMKSVRDKFPQKDVVLVSMGGEPTLCKKLIPTIEKLDGIKQYLMTNGSKNIDWWRTNCEHFQTVNVSYHHGQTNPKHFYQVCRLLSERGVPLLVSIAMNPDYFDECYNFALFLRDNVQQAFVQLKILREDLKYKRFPYNDEQLDILIKKSLLKNPQYKKDNSMLEIIARYEDTNRVIIEEENYSKGKYCNSGIDSFYVDKNGGIYRATCKAGGKLGDVTDLTYNLDVDHMICPINYCNCLTDITNIRKSKDYNDFK
jgi:organic radical activating enzyme